MSHTFTVKNGVHQGSVLSPSVFKICVDGLLGQSKRSGYSAKVFDLYMGAIAYADDISFVSPTVFGMNSDTYTKDH